MGLESISKETIKINELDFSLKPVELRAKNKIGYVPQWTY